MSDFSFETEQEMLAAVRLHRLWLDSCGEVGSRFRFRRAPFRVDLAGAHLSQADFEGADLRGAVFFLADLRGASFSGADLSGADLCDALVEGAAFVGAVLSEADVRGCVGLP